MHYFPLDPRPPVWLISKCHSLINPRSSWNVQQMQVLKFKWHIQKLIFWWHVGEVHVASWKFELFKRFAGKLSDSRSVSFICDHFLFCICYNFGIQFPVKYHYNHWFFFVNNNGNRTEWSPIRSVIIRVICQSLVWSQTELDETKSLYQLIITITISGEKIHLGQTSPVGTMSKAKNLEISQFFFRVRDCC